jgi:hypothetical protein
MKSIQKVWRNFQNFAQSLKRWPNGGHSPNLVTLLEQHNELRPNNELQILKPIRNVDVYGTGCSAVDSFKCVMSIFCCKRVRTYNKGLQNTAKIFRSLIRNENRDSLKSWNV